MTAAAVTPAVATPARFAPPAGFAQPAGFASPADALTDAVRSCLEAELATGAGAWAEPADRPDRSINLTGLGTTAAGALGSQLLAAALAAQRLQPASVMARTSVDVVIGDRDWDLGLVLSPFKIEVGAALDDLSPSAAATGIVDTLLRRDSRVIGLNTNSWALGAALAALLPGVGQPRVLVLGAGGTARSALLAIRRRWSEAEVFVSARRASSASELLNRFPVSFVEPADTADLGVSLVINSTTWGETTESETTPFAFPSELLLTPGTVLFDLNNRRSALQDRALAAGCTVMSGTLMQRVTHACRAAAARCVLDGGDR